MIHDCWGAKVSLLNRTTFENLHTSSAQPSHVWTETNKQWRDLLPLPPPSSGFPWQRVCSWCCQRGKHQSAEVGKGEWMSFGDFNICWGSWGRLYWDVGVVERGRMPMRWICLPQKMASWGVEVVAREQLSFHPWCRDLQYGGSWGSHWGGEVAERARLSMGWMCICAALKLQKWAREQGCPWNESTGNLALSTEFDDVAIWAMENGCAFDESYIHGYRTLRVQPLKTRRTQWHNSGRVMVMCTVNSLYNLFYHPQPHSVVW